jgi:prepilin-type N-terminal cleavage/methylation domain-containing protein
MSSTGRKKVDRSGFTLLELAVVLLIVTTFLCAVSPRIGALFTDGDLSLASRMLVREIGRIRGLSAYTHKGMELGLKIGSGSFYPIEVPAAGVGGWTIEKKEEAPEASILPEGVLIEDVVLLSRGKIQEGEARIRFSPNGCVERSLIHLRNRSDDSYTLKINPLTGQVKIYETYVEEKAR